MIVDEENDKAFLLQHEKLEESYERLKQVQEQVSITNLQMLVCHMYILDSILRNVARRFHFLFKFCKL